MFAGAHIVAHRPIADDTLVSALRAEGYTVTISDDSTDIESLVHQCSPALVLLHSTFVAAGVCAQLFTQSIPIIVVGSTDVSTTVSCLDTGADDCLHNGYSYIELSARIRALLRRRADPASLPLRLDIDNYEAWVYGKNITLTRGEFRLLQYFYDRQASLVTRNELLHNIWNQIESTDTNIVEMFVSNLRHKLEQYGDPRMLHTKRGLGYILKFC